METEDNVMDAFKIGDRVKGPAGSGVIVGGEVVANHHKHELETQPFEGLAEYSQDALMLLKFLASLIAVRYFDAAGKTVCVGLHQPDQLLMVSNESRMGSMDKTPT
jgi:hypothetical protein